jgi:CO/xanthine dehydrogenase Mo-binding subunit
VDIAPTENDPADSLVGQLTHWPAKTAHAFSAPSGAYTFAHRRSSWETVAPFLDRASPLRTGHLRDPLGPEVHFASESFIDEIAHAAGEDPVAFRLRYINDARHVAVIRAAAERAHWQPGPAAGRGQGEIMHGRGFSYTERMGTVVAMVAEVEVERSSGRIWARKFTVAHDCGLIINPDGLKLVIEGNVMQALSRTLFEELQFDRRQVSSIDWMSYPILEMQDAPEMIDIVLLDRPERAPSGAGEPATRTVPAAVANAVFDATGIRLRKVPLTPQRMKAALAGALAHSYG